MFDAKITRFFSFSSLHSHFRTTVARTDFYFLFFAFSMRSSTFWWIDFTQTQILPNILRFFLFNFRSAWIRRIDNTNNCPRHIYSIFPSPTCVGRSMLTHRSMHIILYNLIFGAFVPISQIQIVSALRKWSVQCTHSIRSKWYEAWIKRNSISIEWIDTLSYGWFCRWKLLAVETIEEFDSARVCLWRSSKRSVSGELRESIFGLIQIDNHFSFPIEPRSRVFLPQSAPSASTHQKFTFY